MGNNEEDDDEERSPSWLVVARKIYIGAFPVLFIAAIFVYSQGQAEMPKAVRLEGGGTAYFLCSWLGAMFWPLGTFLFFTYIAVGYGLGLSSKRSPMFPPSNQPQPLLFLWFMGFAMALAVILPEFSGVSPFRHFYCVVVSEDTIVLQSGLWSRTIPCSDIAEIKYHVREYSGKKEFRYPGLSMRNVSGTAWRSVEKQCEAGEPKLLKYETFMLNVVQQVKLHADL